MADVPDTNTFTLQDVVASVTPSSPNLVTCFAEASGNFDPTYEGAKDRLSNFRNYKDQVPFVWGGWTAPVSMNGQSYRSYANGDGKMVATNHNGQQAEKHFNYSLDGGATWIQNEVPNLSSQTRSVRFVNGNFFFFGQRNQFIVYTSDFVNFTEMSTNALWTDLCYDGTAYYACVRGSGITNVQRFATLGSVPTNVGNASTGNLTIAAFKGSIITLGGISGSGMGLYKSENGGANWIQGAVITSSALQATFVPKFKQSANQLRANWGGGGAIMPFFYTTDAITFTNDGANASSDNPTFRTYFPTYGNGEWATGQGNPGETALRMANSSDEAATPWTQRSMPFSGSNTNQVFDNDFDESTREFGFICGAEFIKTTGN